MAYFLPHIYMNHIIFISNRQLKQSLYRPVQAPTLLEVGVHSISRISAQVCGKVVSLRIYFLYVQGDILRTHFC